MSVGRHKASNPDVKERAEVLGELLSGRKKELIDCLFLKGILHLWQRGCNELVIKVFYHLLSFLFKTIINLRKTQNYRRNIICFTVWYSYAQI
jgi:hypothetical protein